MKVLGDYGRLGLGDPVSGRGGNVGEVATSAIHHITKYFNRSPIRFNDQFAERGSTPQLTATRDMNTVEGMIESISVSRGWANDRLVGKVKLLAWPMNSGTGVACGIIHARVFTMFNLHGPTYRHCDGVPRRAFLQAGAFGLTGLSSLTLADLLRAESEQGVGSSHKAVINIHLDGGPPQMDTIDMKPDGPEHVRGEFKPIKTKLPGFYICEHLPKIASIADRFAFVRSLVGSIGQHHAFQCQSGFDEASLKSLGGRPAMGCVVSKLLGSPTDDVPAFVDMMQGRPFVRNSARAGFLGPAYKAFRPNMNALFERPLEDGMKVELARRSEHHATSLKLIDSLSVDRLRDRRALLRQLDRTKRHIDATGMMEAMDRFTQQAVGILTSGKFADALDLSKEDARMVKRYTAGSSQGQPSVTTESPRSSLKFLMARRLVEAGVRVVSLSISDFDTHSKNYPRLKHLLPIIDTGIHALVTDLEDRGMLDDVSIVIWGEFGRTPKINAKGGRDHWPRVSPALLAGGGMKVGQVIGATDRHAAEVTKRPVHYQDVIATLYQNLGIDPTRTTVTDPKGRPQYLVEKGEVVRELV